MNVTVATSVKKGLNRERHENIFDVTSDQTSGALEIVLSDASLVVYEHDEWLSYTVPNPVYPHS